MWSIVVAETREVERIVGYQATRVRCPSKGKIVMMSPCWLDELTRKAYERLSLLRRLAKYSK